MCDCNAGRDNPCRHTECVHGVVVVERMQRVVRVRRRADDGPDMRGGHVRAVVRGGALHGDAAVRVERVRRVERVEQLLHLLLFFLEVILNLVP